MTGVRLRQLAALPSPLAHALQWQPLAATGAAGLALGAVLPAGDEPAAVLRARFLAAALGAAGAYITQDDAADVLAPSPSPRRFRTGLRVATAVAGGYAWWVAGAGVSSRRVGAGSLLRAVSVEALALLLLGVAAAAVASRRVGQRGCGVAAAPVLFGLLIVSSQLPAAWSLMGDPADTAVRRRWLVVLVAAAAVVAAWLLDPGRASRLGRVVPRRSAR